MSSNNPHIWRLDGEDTCAMFFAASDNAVPRLFWFGKSLATSVDVSTIAALDDLPLPMAKLDAPVALDLFPQASSGIDCHPALRAHRNGKQFNHRLRCGSVKQSSNVKQHSEELTIDLTDPDTDLKVTLSIALHATSGVLSMSTKIANTGKETLNIEWLAAGTIALPATYTDCIHLHGRWGLECQQHRQVIGPHRLLLENTRGRTSHELYPAAIIGEAGFDENKGDVMAMHLAWSGSHRTIIERLSDGRSYVQSGVAPDVGELVLAAGESLHTPAMHLARGNHFTGGSTRPTAGSPTCISAGANAGINAASQRMHKFVRSEILPPWTRTPRPIHANSWEALYFDHDIDKLRQLIDAASRLGAERFVLDDGWFPARRADNAGLGDWRVDTSVYPDGLHPLVAAVRAAGMQFGLWFEPEMVNPDSDLFRAHPEWTCHLQPFDTPLARNQLPLNLALPEVRDYLYNSISALVEEYSIDYLKWDQNRDLVMAGNGSRSQMREQVTGCYQLIDQLNKRFPTLEIESCASGGARADWGILQRTGRVWTSDSIDAVDRLRIQRGYSLFNPPEITGAHIGHQVAHLTGRAIDIHTRAIIALQGQLGFELNAAVINDDEATIIRHYVALYKKHRNWIANALYWRLESPVKHLLASGMVDSSKERSLWFVVAENSLPTTVPGKLFPMGLDPSRTYTVQLVSDNLQQLEHFSKKIPGWLKTPLQVNGELLMQIGLNLPTMPAQSALLLEISAASLQQK